MQIIEISDWNDTALDVYARLSDAQLKSRQHAENALFIAESHTVIEHALDAGYEPVSFLMTKRHISGQGKALMERCPNVPVYTAEDDLLRNLTGYAMTRGMLCAMRRRALPDAEDICSAARRIAVLENIVDPTNIGSIFRSAAALGMDAVLLTPSCCDPLSRRSIRVSMGTIFQVPWTRLHGTAEDWKQNGIATLQRMGFHTAALALRADSVRLEDAALNREPRLAIILGTEGYGLLPETIEASDYTVYIPMAHGVDSLNVGVAGAIAFWQLGKRD